MNNTERFFWLLGVFVLCFYALNQSSKIENLQSVNEIQKLAFDMKSNKETRNVSLASGALSQEYLLNSLLDSIDSEIEAEEEYLEIISNLIADQ
tara:strand:- start:3550 stop:3831 length:282 start_codon:yes stop_codon:yes gene_type:complete